MLAYVVPATSRAPSMFSISEEKQKEIVHLSPGSGSDMLFMVFSAAQINASYKKACFDRRVRALLPQMKIHAFTGTATCCFSLPAYWAMEDDDKAHGGGLITFSMHNDVNHFVSPCFSCVCGHDPNLVQLRRSTGIRPSWLSKYTAQPYRSRLIATCM